MKNRNIIKPTGLKGKEVINRMKELMGSTSINEDVKGSVVELTKEGPDGKVYAIIRENHEYYIKVSENKSNLVTEDFNYIGGLQNKKDKAYPSYAKAIKQLNLKFMSLNEAIGKSGQVNVFEDDNLLTEHHPLKADMKLSADKGIGDGAEYVVDKKGAELKYDSKEGKEDDGFGDNVADSTAEKDIEEVKLNETETAIDEMITGEGTAASFMNKWKTPSENIKNMFPSNMNVGLIYSPEHGGENYAISEKGGKYFLHAFTRAAEPGEGKEFNDLESAKEAIPVNNMGNTYMRDPDLEGLFDFKNKGFSIARAIQEMDEVIDSLATEDDKVDEILESLSEEGRAIMMEALKKKD